MTTPGAAPLSSSSSCHKLPSALETAAFAVSLLEDNPLFNSARGAVFTRDGVNELEASVMVSRGRLKRGVGVMGLRRVRNPILLAKAVLEHGDADLGGGFGPGGSGGGDGDEGGGVGARYVGPTAIASAADPSVHLQLDVPSAQGHTLLWGETAEVLAVRYGLEMVDPMYFWTLKRWQEHERGLEREKARSEQGADATAAATWSADEYLPQGTCGAVALDEAGVVCCATSTGGLTNKLTGRIGDTPVVGAGFWAEEWEEEGDPMRRTAWERLRENLYGAGPMIEVAGFLKGLMADCLPTPWSYSPVPGDFLSRTSRGRPMAGTTIATTVTRSMAGSGTGNGDSFLRTAALRSVAAIARWKSVTTAEAVDLVSGPGGELQRSAGSRWGKTGEGEGGIIGIECAVARDKATGEVVETRGTVVQAHNCGGMFRAWVDEEGNGVVSVWRETEDEDDDDEKRVPSWAKGFEGVPSRLRIAKGGPGLEIRDG